MSMTFVSLHWRFVLQAGSLKETVTAMLDQLTRRDSASRLDLQKGDEVAVIISNLGYLTQLELANITKEVVTQLS